MVTLPPIPTAISHVEAQGLAGLARGKLVLEVGSDFGFSTILLASVAHRVHAVDWFRGDPHAGFKDTLLAFWTNLGQAGVREKVIVHIGDVADVVPLFPKGFFDVAFVDAFHEESAVFEDGLRCSRVLRPGGALAFHDYGRFGVAPAVDRLRDTLGARIQVVETLAILTFP